MINIHQADSSQPAFFLPGRNSQYVLGVDAEGRQRQLALAALTAISMQASSASFTLRV